MLVCIKSCHPVFYADTHPAKKAGYIEKGSKISKYTVDDYFYNIYEYTRSTITPYWKLQYRKDNFVTLEQFRTLQIDSIDG